MTIKAVGHKNKKRIAEMSVSEILKYLNTGVHSIPVLASYVNDDGERRFGIHSSKGEGMSSWEYKFEEFTDLSAALERYQEIIKGPESDPESK